MEGSLLLFSFVTGPPLCRAVAAQVCRAGAGEESEAVADYTEVSGRGCPELGN